jgi:lysozyme
MNRDSLRALLIRHEGLSLKAYKDSLGFLTIGYGRCLDTTGISEPEANALLDNDISKCVAYCREAFSWFDALDDARQNVICSMIFNMGAAKFAEFKKLIAAVIAKDYNEAANQMRQSVWAGQVGKRASELAQMMIDGDTIH